VFNSIAGGRKSGRVRYALACPCPSGSAEALVREVGSQPSVHVSAVPVADSVPTNLRRVILPLGLSFMAHFSAK
jgi:hypothetical protein